MPALPELKPFQRPDYALYGALAGLKMWIHMATSGRYGMFRDEFYYLACASRLDWGYVDQPPLSIWILSLTRALLGDSVLATRLPAIAATGVIVVLIGLLTRRMGGGRFAQGIAMAAFICCPMMLGVHSYFSMNSFDHLFWVAAAYVLVLIIQSGNARLWLVFGLLCGLGLQNKMSMLFFGAGLVAALALTPERKWFRSPWLYAGGGVALLVFLPNLIWQWANDFPTYHFMKNAALYKNAPVSPLEFTLNQVVEYHPLLVPFWILALVYPFRKEALRDYRPLAIVFLTVFAIFALTSGKTYYMAPAYLLLFPLGAVALERLTGDSKRWPPAIAYMLIAATLPLMPLALEMMPPRMAADYMSAIGIGPAPGERGQEGALPQHFADRLGWPARAALVKEAYDSLSPEEQAACVVYGSNYGEAGAMEYYAEEYGLPPAVSGHNNYWLWGPGKFDGSVAILIVAPDSEALNFFESVEDFGITEEPMQLVRWQEMHVYVVRGMKEPVADVWQKLRFYI